MGVCVRLHVCMLTCAPVFVCVCVSNVLLLRVLFKATGAATSSMSHFISVTGNEMCCAVSTHSVLLDLPQTN